MSTPFETDLDFCPHCGSVLPLPGMDDVVSCKRCSYKIDVKDFDGVEIHSSVEFNHPESMMMVKEKQSQITGPTADRKCSKCGNEKMVYTTQQTRSADEGQTVFFTCPNCRFQEIEYS